MITGSAKILLNRRQFRRHDSSTSMFKGEVVLAKKRNLVVRYGFTLVELLVVIAIIGVMVGLLLPAVQAAREAARRMQCSNNLKQVGLALQNYHDTFKSFPSGYIVDTATAGTAEGWAWGALILPYIEQGALHEQLGVTQRALRAALTTGNTFKPLFQTPVFTYICPTDSGFSPGYLAVNRPFNGGLGTVAGGLEPLHPPLSNYIGVSGHRDVVNDVANTGILFGNSRVRFADVVDGTSNTVAVGERETLNAKSGTWIGIRAPGGSSTAGVNVAIGHSHPKINDITAANPWNTDRIGGSEGFSSLHPGGAQFVFCDGSVRFLSETIEHWWAPDPASLVNGGANAHTDTRNGLYQRLLSRDDQLIVNEF